MTKYAIGIQDFSTIRKEGYLYVDKTQYISYLLDKGKYFFLGRPRRFGKSLFLSTLEYFFSGERELFQGLAIESYKWDWRKYPVIHLDLNGADYTRPGVLEDRLGSVLAEYENTYKLRRGEGLNIQERFRLLISSLYEKIGEPIAVLIDEHEKPVIDTLENKELNDSNKATLHGFYGVLKSMDKCLKFVFFTGVTKFAQMNVFSGLNNIKDISLNEEFGAICGVTTKELEKYFLSGIKEFSNKRKISVTDVLQLLKDNYDGYHFSENCPDIYNPYSLLNAFSDLKIRAYWSYTGTPTRLVKLLIQKEYDLRKLNGIRASANRLMGINTGFDDPVVLFYQTGYLTIKRYEEDLDEFILGFPNQEVEKAFLEFIIPFYYKNHHPVSEALISSLSKYLMQGEAKKAMETLESFSAGLSYDLIPKPETERHFQSLLYIIIKLISSQAIKITPEFKTSDGRIDLLIETPDFVYIIEIKKDRDPEEALRQIERKAYGLQFEKNSREVFYIGMNFSTEKKRIDGFLIN